MSYCISFEFKDKNKNKENESDLWYWSGWDIARYADVFRSFGTPIKIDDDEEESLYETPIYEMSVKNLLPFKQAADSIRKLGLLEKFNYESNNESFEEWFYDNVLKYEEERSIEYLLNNVERYNVIKNPSIAKSIRKADIEYCDEKEKELKKSRVNFYKEFNEALNQIQNEEIKYFLKEYCPISLICITSLGEMQAKLSEKFGEDCKLLLYS